MIRYMAERTSLFPPGRVLVDPDLLAELVAVLRGAGVDVEPTALELSEHGDRARVILDQARADLLVRLHNRPDDFAATEALQAVYSASARLGPHVDRCERDRLVHAGLSGVDRMRIWLRTRIGSPRRPAGAAVRAPRPAARPHGGRAAALSNGSIE
jgi:hypothetical protein